MGGWALKSQKHDDVILEWSLSDLKNSDTKNDKTRQKTCKFMNEKYLSLNMVTLEEQELHMKSHKQRFFTTSKMDRHLLRQKV